MPAIPKIKEDSDSRVALKTLAPQDADAWIDYHKIKNEKGEPIDWVKHMFQIEIYNDQSQNLVVMKPAQVGLCLDPKTLILCNDYRWRKIDDIKVGQKIISVDESSLGKMQGRKKSVSTVEAKNEVLEDAIKIILENGTEIIATPNHRFLSQRRGAVDTQWRTVKDFKIGDTMRYFCDVWGDGDYEDGWMGGMIDGEGSLRRKGGSELTIVQTEGHVLDRLIKYFDNHGYIYHSGVRKKERSGLGSKPIWDVTTSNTADIYKIIGQTRPSRFVNRTNWWEGACIGRSKTEKSWFTIKKIELLSKRRMIDIQTKSKTFIANGFVSHNSTLEIIKTVRDAEAKKMDIIYCVDTETEALTKKGFKRYSEINLNDELLTLSLDGVSKWQKVLEVFVNRVDTTMYRFDGRNFNAFVTANHRWIVQGKRRGELLITQTDKFKKRGLFIPKVATNYKDPIQTLNDSYVELLSWVFSEGYYSKQKGKNDYSIIISQSERVNLAYCEEIRKCLKNNGITWKEYFNKHSDCINFRFAFELGRKIKLLFPFKLPTAEFALSLTRRQAKLFIDTFVKADGWIDKSGTSAISQKDKECVEVLCLISVIAGYVPSILPPGKNGSYTIRLTQFDKVYVEELKPIITQEKDILIWCPRTEDGTFYARRKGRCYWTGNTLPTEQDVGVFVGGKVNRIIANNPYMEKLTKDKDTIEQKRIGQSMIYFRGTWSKKAAIMVTADRLVHDEKDSSKQDVIADYQARLQHSKFKQTHVFSHPSIPNSGVDMEWKISDQKEWFITCPHCQYKQILTWNTEDEKKMSINIEKEQFECKKCHGVLSWQDRAVGEWKPKKGTKDAEYSGYHVSLLMAAWVTAKEIIKKYKEVVAGKQTMDYFYNKVLGLPYSGGGNSVTEDMIKDSVTADKNLMQGRMVIGVDTGIKLRYVYGNTQGLLGYGEMTDYFPDEINGLALNQTLEYFLTAFPNSVMVIDQGGDIIGARKMREKYPGRVFLCHYARDRKTMQLIRWGEKDESGNVLVDRNRMIQLLVDYWRDKRIRLYRGTKEDWHEYWLHWSHIYRIAEENSLGVTEYKWLRSDRDDWVHCLDGDTLVTVEDGSKKIKDINVGDYVLTREGFRYVEKSGMTYSEAEVYQLNLDDGSKIIGTPTHRIWTENNGWKHLKNITTDDILVGIWKIKQSHTKERNLDYTGVKDTLRVQRVKDCIELFGKNLTEKFLKVFTFTTKTVITSTMRLKILSYFQQENMLVTRQKIERILQRPVQFVTQNIKAIMWARTFTVQSNADHEFIVKNTTKWRGNVSSVKNDLPPILMGGVSHVLRTVRIKGLVKLKEKRPVYNISVKGEHEYFANGLLVANSTLYWYVGLTRFGATGGIVAGTREIQGDSYMLEPDQTVEFSPDDMFGGKKSTEEEPWWAEPEDDWRN